MAPKKRKGPDDSLARSTVSALERSKARDCEPLASMPKKSKTVLKDGPSTRPVRNAGIKGIKESAPREKALGITEILERIISFLLPKDILRLQRVSHMWKNCITASHPIQQNAFVRLRKTPPEIRTQNYMYSKGWVIKPAREIEKSIMFTPVTLNPFVKLENADMPPKKRLMYYLEQHVILTGSLKSLLQSNLTKTYLSDPPTCFNTVKLQWHCPPTDWLEARTFMLLLFIEADSPATIAEIVDAAVKKEGLVGLVYTLHKRCHKLCVTTEIIFFLYMTFDEALQAFSGKHQVSLRLEEAEVKITLRGTDDRKHRPIVLSESDYADVQ